MPIYEYRCTACNHRFEFFLQSPTEKVSTKCPDCGEDKLEKLISAPAFHLKGTGWYVTDFKNPAKPSSESPGNKGEQVQEKEQAKSEEPKKEVPTEPKDTPASSSISTTTKKADKAD